MSHPTTRPSTSDNGATAVCGPPAHDASPLFATTPIVDAHEPPLIVVGLPRSGTSFLADLLSQMPDWYVFDDLFLYRKAKSIGVDGPLSPAQLDQLIRFLGWQIRARMRFKQFSVPQMAWEDVDRMDRALSETFRGRTVQWHELMEEWLTRLSQHHGCHRWGFKATQDFLHLGVLQSVFPETRFIFVLRDPRTMLASKKFVRAEDGHPAAYHPIVYSVYWKMAVERMLSAARPLSSPVLSVRFEDLVADPAAEGRRLAEFLETQLEGEIEIPRPNTSFGSGKQRRTITPTESWFCERIAGSAMLAQGYSLGEGRFRLRDLPELCWITVRFGCYQLWRLASEPSARVSVVAFLRNLLRGK